MDSGLVHIYYGDGKGKTTAAVGLGIRACGKGKKVLFVQFLKDNLSGELITIEKLSDDFQILKGKPVKKFVFSMSAEEREETAKEMTSLFDKAVAVVSEGHCDVVIFDELIDAINLNLIEKKRLSNFLESRPIGLEVIITGHNPSQDIIDLGDYVTEMKKVRHPYDKGTKARDGIEK